MNTNAYKNWKKEENMMEEKFLTESYMSIKN